MDHKINLKECEKKDKYLDLARELKKLWDMKVTIVPIVIGAFGTITKGLLKGLESENIKKFLEFSRELKKLWKMKGTVIQTVVDELRTVSKSLERKLGELVMRGRVETIQTTRLLWSATIIRGVLDSWCPSDSNEWPSAKTEIIIIIIIIIIITLWAF